ncbi:MAG: hypothetical protein GY805_27025, partial [Chloroflexi bacterium]|nr:hypothetical protein [Chloroflexota bacterium]
DTVSLSGDDFVPEWPNPTLAQDQREGERTESYEVVFNADGDSYTYHPDSLNEYGRFEDNNRWILQVNTFNAVVSVEPEQ